MTGHTIKSSVDNSSEAKLPQVLSGFGQIKRGDLIECMYKKRKRQYRVRSVLMSGTDREEIIINFTQNRYFITSMALAGTSWAKDVQIINANTLQ